VSTPGGLTATGVIIGTPGYMAPEQAGGLSKLTGPATDVYALGAILYEMLTGQPPFQADTPLETVRRVVSDEPAPPRRLQPWLPRDLEAVCLKCLEKEPVRRYASAQDLADDLARFQRSERTLARPLGALGRLVRWAHQRPRLAVTWSALVLLYGQHLVQLALGTEGEGGDFHWFVTGLVAVAAVGAAFFQWLLGRPVWRTAATYGWTALDVALLTAVLLRGDGPRSALLGVYPLLVAGAALRFRISLVWFVTGLCVLSYAGLQADALWRRPELAARGAHPPVFVASLLLLGLILHFVLRRGQSALATEV
ncbi:MAG TPA: hypothetical protein VG013_12770, partial [Gemmataceae bacterium]|nr:hypothetical protein [Gemmataceae bacterium]